MLIWNIHTALARNISRFASGRTSMGGKSFLGAGKVVNNSDGQVYCWVQDDGPPEIYVLDRGMQSTSLIDVDLVKAFPPAILDPGCTFGDGRNNTAMWFKFRDIQTATISGNSPHRLIDISLTATSWT